MSEFRSDREQDLGHNSRLPVVAVIGASSAEPHVLRIAEEVGRAVAARGWHLVCGGGGGVMEAACRGFGRGRRAPEARNLALGILPGDDPDWANAHVDLVVPSGIGIARNAVITRTAQAVIAIGGCSGTLSEIAFAWQMGRPIVALADGGGWAAELAGSAVDDRRDDTILSAASAEEAIELLAPLIDGT
jgi:uncharacterized protein (TIGR00725 family)